MEIFKKIWAILAGICWYWFSRVLLKSRLLPMNKAAPILLVTLILTALLIWILLRSKKAESKRTGQVLMSISFVALTLLMGVQVFAGNYINKTFSTLNKVVVENENEEHKDDKGEKKAKKRHNDSFYLYVSGIDTRGDLDKKSRSDVNLVLAINPDTHKIFVTSVPRDTYLPISGQGRDKYDKLTHSGLYGSETGMDSLSNFFSIDIPYYVRLNFSSMENIIDALGGIEVDNPEEFVSIENYHFPEGRIELDGKKALVFARERYQLKDGELARGRNHIRIIKGVVDKACSPSILLHYSDFMDVIGENIQTNVPKKLILSMVQNQIEDNKSWSIDAGQVQGTGLMGLPSFAFRDADLFMFVPSEDSVWENYCKMESVMDDKDHTDDIKPRDWMDHIQTEFNHTISYDEWQSGVPINHSNWYDPNFGKDTKEKHISPEDAKKTYREDVPEQRSNRKQEEDYFEERSDWDEILQQMDEDIRETDEERPPEEVPAYEEESAEESKQKEEPLWPGYSENSEQQQVYIPPSWSNPY